MEEEADLYISRNGRCDGKTLESKTTNSLYTQREFDGHFADCQVSFRVSEVTDWVNGRAFAVLDGDPL